MAQKIQIHTAAVRVFFFYLFGVVLFCNWFIWGFEKKPAGKECFPNQSIIKTGIDGIKFIRDSKLAQFPKMTVSRSGSLKYDSSGIVRIKFVSD